MLPNCCRMRVSCLLFLHWRGEWVNLCGMALEHRMDLTTSDTGDLHAVCSKMSRGLAPLLSIRDLRTQPWGRGRGEGSNPRPVSVYLLRYRQPTRSSVLSLVQKFRPHPSAAPVLHSHLGLARDTPGSRHVRGDTARRR